MGAEWKAEREPVPKEARVQSTFESNLPPRGPTYGVRSREDVSRGRKEYVWKTTKKKKQK